MNNINSWYKKYELAKKYFDYHGNLEIPQNFKTINGIDYDENGIALGSWISRQRKAYKGIGSYKLTEDRKNLLDEIGMVVDIYDKIWNEYYDLAKDYYKQYKNLKVPQKFITENGLPLGKWIKSQRLAFNGKGTYKLTENQIKLLDEIEMIWYTSEKIYNKYQAEEINESNKKRKQIEILNRVRSYLNTLDEETLPTKEEINKGMVKVLNRRNN